MLFNLNQPEILSWDEILKEENLDFLKDKDDLMELLASYNFMMNPIARRALEEQFGIHLEEYNLRIQLQFLNFLIMKNKKEVEKVAEFTKRFGRDGLRCFLSLEHGGLRMGEKILEIGKKFKSNIVEKIFTKYGELIDLTNELEEEIKNVIKKIQITDFDSIRETILQDATKLLKEFSNLSPEEYTEKEILQKIEFHKPLIYLKVVLVRTIVEEKRKKNQSLNIDSILSEISDFEFNKFKVADLSDKDKEEMKEIFKENWRQLESEIGKSAVDKIINEFNNLLEDENNSFYIFRDTKEKQIIAFIRIDPSAKEREWDATSLNVRPYIRGNKLSEPLLRSTIDAKAKEGITILGTVFPRLPICPHYIEDYKFNAYGFTNKYGPVFFEIRRNDQENELYSYKIKDAKDIINEYTDNKIVPDQDHYILRYDFGNRQDYQLFIQQAESLFGQGYIMTRFIRSEGQSYLVFEKKKEIGKF